MAAGGKTYEWKAESLPWDAIFIFGGLGIVGVVLSLVMLIQSAIRGDAGGIIAGVLCGSGSVFIGSLVTVLPMRIMMSRERIEVHGLWRFVRRLDGARVAGVLPKPWISKRSDVQVSLALRDQRGSWMLRELSRFGEVGEVRRAAVELFGALVIHPVALPSGDQIVAAENHFICHGEFRWRPRFGSLVSMLGLKAVAFAVSLAFTWRSYQAWLTQQAVVGPWIAVTLTIASAVAIAFAMLTLLDLARGGPVREISATHEDITLHLWWKKVRIPCAEFRGLCVHWDQRPRGITLLFLAAAPHVRRPARRPAWRLMQGRWRGPSGSDPRERIGMVAPMLLLFEPLFAAEIKKSQRPREELQGSLVPTA